MGLPGNDTTEKIRKEIAECVKRGWPVFRLRANSKEPVDATGFHTATKTPDLEKLWPVKKNYNYGIRTGIEAGFFVVDVDGDEGYEQLRALEKKNGELPHTVAVKTGGGGTHYFFRSTGEMPRLTPLSHAIHTRGEGGYIVGPASVHPDGPTYEWEVSPDEADIAFAPQWVLDKVLPKPKEEKRTVEDVQRDLTEEQLAIYNHHVRQALVAMDEGASRHDTLFSLACQLRDNRIPLEDTLHTLRELQAHVASKKSRRVSRSEVDRITQDVYGTAPRDPADFVVLPDAPGPKPLALGNATTVAATPSPDGWPDLDKPVTVVKPEFPREVFSRMPWFQEYVDAVSQSCEVPFDMPAMVGLGISSIATAAKFCINPRPGWVEPSNLYITLVAGVGAGKSRTLKVMQGPLSTYEVERTARLNEGRAEAESQLNILKRQKAACEKSGEIMQAGEIAKQLQRLQDELPCADGRLFVSEATDEALADLLSTHDEVFAVLSAEGKIWDIAAGLYSTGTPNFVTLLGAYSGDSARTGRISRVSKPLQHPLLSVCVSVQPAVIESMGKTASFNGRGLIPRFMFSYPDIGFEAARHPPAISTELHGCWRDYILNTLKTELQLDGSKHFLKFTPDAQELFLDIHVWAKSAIAPDGQMSDVAEWGSRYAGNLARLCVHLHLLQSCTAPQYRATLPIDLDTVVEAKKLMDYTLAHTRAVYGVMAADQASGDAMKIVGWLKANKTEVTSPREIYRSLARSLKSTDVRDAAIKELVAAGYLKTDITKTKLFVNPKVHLKEEK